MNSADTEGAIRDRGIAIAECEGKRKLLIDAWPLNKDTH